MPPAEEQGGRVLGVETPSYVNKRGEAPKHDEEQAGAEVPTLPNYGTATDDDGRK